MGAGGGGRVGAPAPRVAHVRVGSWWCGEAMNSILNTSVFRLTPAQSLHSRHQLTGGMAQLTAGAVNAMNNNNTGIKPP